VLFDEGEEMRWRSMAKDNSLSAEETNFCSAEVKNFANLG